MRKAEVNPFAESNDATSSSDTTSSDSEFEVVTEDMDAQLCDGVTVPTQSDDEPSGQRVKTDGQIGETCCRKKGKGRRGKGKDMMHPRMAMMIMMGGPPPPLPHFMAHMINGRPHGRHGGPCGPCGPRFGPPGPPGRGPCTRRRFMRYMKDHPELWKKMQEKFAEKQLAEEFSKMDVASASENQNDKSEAAVTDGKESKCGKKCHGKREKRREMWQRLMQHMFEEMNLHASTESSEGDEGNHTDKCSEEENGTEAEAAAKTDKKKVHFGDGTKDDEGDMVSVGFPWMFPGIPWGRPGMFRRFHHGGPWARPAHFRGMGMGGDPRIEMHCDPRMMMHGDPRMGHSDPRMMFGCRPRRWMFRHMMKSASSEDENTASEGEEHQGTSTKARRQKMREERKEFRKMAREMGWFPRRCGFPQSDSDAEKSDDAAERDRVKREAGDMNREEAREMREKMREEMRDKRQQFRRFVQETGVHPWMFKTLAQELYGSKKSDAAAESAEKPQDEEMVGEEQKNADENKEKFLQILKELGTYPWMFRVLANQRARAAVTTGSESEGEVPLEGAAAADEGSPDRCRRRQKRQMFREMAKQMGWTSDSDIHGEKDQSEGAEEEKERRKEEKQNIREMRREMVWMPWMKMMRGRHHHHRHHHRHSPPHHVDSSRRHHHHHHDGDRHGSHHLAH